ncbi:MAG: septum formation initiator family protein [Lachnospiraceae bacterium]|jgi:cell division protein FtsB|nr:septum formation initiator family protein [Lachnospiraceae bacterium]
MARQVAYRKSRQNRFGMFLAGIVVLMLLIVVSIGSYSLRQKLDNYKQREASLEEQIAFEHERAKELESQEKYTHTMKFVEETARKRLGLVYEGEVIFRQNR